MPLKVITSNRLCEGDVVYLTGNGKWSLHLNEAKITSDTAELENLLAQAEADVAARLVVSVYAMEVVEFDGILQPLSAREIIRAAGPTVRADYRPAPNSKAA